MHLCLIMPSIQVRYRSLRYFCASLAGGPKLFPSYSIFSDSSPPSLFFPAHYNIHTLQTTHQEEDRDEKKSQHTKKEKFEQKAEKKSEQKVEKKSHPAGEIKSQQPSDEKKPKLADEQKPRQPDEKKTFPEEETTPHPTQHIETDKGEKALFSKEKKERLKPDERLEDSDSSSDFSQSAESSRKSSLSESSSRELNEVDLIDGKDRNVSHFAKQIFFRLYSHKSYASFFGIDF